MLGQNDMRLPSFRQLPHSSVMDENTFTCEEVRNIICEGCRKGLRETRCDGVITHHCNETSFPCTARAWRTNQAALAKEQK